MSDRDLLNNEHGERLLDECARHIESAYYDRSDVRLTLPEWCATVAEEVLEMAGPYLACDARADGVAAGAAAGAAAERERLADYFEKAAADPLFTGGDRATVNALLFAARFARSQHAVLLAEELRGGAS